MTRCRKELRLFVTNSSIFNVDALGIQSLRSMVRSLPVRSLPKKSQIAPSKKSYRSQTKVTLLHVQLSVSKVRPSSLQINDLENFSFLKCDLVGSNLTMERSDHNSRPYADEPLALFFVGYSYLNILFLLSPFCCLCLKLCPL